MMRKAQKLAAGVAAAMMVSAISAPVSFAANKAFGLDEINWTEQDWNSIAMTNDDTVDTGAVIRVQADADSDAAGYLYRGAAARVVEKGDEWTKVQSGKVSGYVKNEFLAYGDEARGLAAHYGRQGVVANWNDVSVFSENNADSSVAGKLNDGMPLSMVEDNGHWITVQNGADSAGFVSEEDVTRVLLVDTAVPADGEDDADVVTTMSAADLPADLPSGTEEAAEVSYAEQSYENYPASSEEYTQPADDYHAEPASYTEDSQAYVTGSYTEDASAAQTASYETTADSTAVLSTQSVSDNSEIQALYDAYISAQNAAMDCTSEEDAKAKADAAIAAWNAYLAACGEPAASASSAGSAAAASAETQTTSSAAGGSAYTDTSYTETAQTAETAGTTAQAVETAPQTEAAASSGGGAYGSVSDLDLLAAIIWCEAGNQPYDGMVAVGQVVMNRVASSSFPNTISEVLNQPGQFTPASAGTLQAAIASGVNSNCYAAAQDAMNGAAPVPGYPLYFNTHSGSYQLGAHYFS
ncbi:MAG: cell wall hydrolase [Lachnospiraceae bacterium]|nr:cell wall hydrolase [Lachnospiraceae bacterium]